MASALVASKQNGGVMATDRCTCCPYGYHIDLDFLRFLDTLYSGDTLRNIRRVRHNRINHSQSYDGFFSDDEVSRYRNYAVSPPPLSSRADNVGRSFSPPADPVDRVTTDEILLEIDSSISKNLYSIEDVDSTVIRKKKTARVVAVAENGSDTQREQGATTTGDGIVEMSPELANCFSGLMSQQTNVDTIEALQSIRDQMLLSLQRMRQMEERMHVIPVLESEVDRLRHENERLRRMCEQQQPSQHQVVINSAEVHQIHTFRDNRGSVLVELPVSVTDNANSSGRLRSIGVGDNDVYGNNIDSLYHELKSKHISHESRTDVHKALTDARRQFFWGSEPDKNPPTASGGWIGRVQGTVKSVRSTGVGDACVWEEDVRRKAPSSVTEVPMTARVNLRVTVSEERLTSEPRWEVERFGSGQFQNVAVQCNIIGGRLLSHWRHSAGDRFTPIPPSMISRTGNAGTDVKHESVEESMIRIEQTKQTYSAWDEKLAQLLQSESNGQDDETVREQEMVLQQYERNDFDWNGALVKLDDCSRDSADDIIQETVVSPVYRQPPQPVDWATVLDGITQSADSDRFVQDDSGEQQQPQQQQPFAPYLSPIRASSVDDIDIDELSNRELEEFDWQVDTGISRSPLSSLTSPSSLPQLTSPISQQQNNATACSPHDVSPHEVVSHVSEPDVLIMASTNTHSDVKAEISEAENVTVVTMMTVAETTVVDESSSVDAIKTFGTDTTEPTSPSQVECLEAVNRESSTEVTVATTLQNDSAIESDISCQQSVCTETNVVACSPLKPSEDQLQQQKQQQQQPQQQVLDTVTETNIDADLPPTAITATACDQSGMTANEGVMKSCRIIITETRVDRQLLVNQTVPSTDCSSDVIIDHSQKSTDVQSSDAIEDCVADTGALSTEESQTFRPPSSSSHCDAAATDVTTPSGPETSADVAGTSFERRSDLSPEMLEACSVYAQWLVDSSKVSLDLKKASVEVIQKQWFASAGRKSSMASEVSAYLSAFEQIHLPLLFAVVNMADHDMNTVLHYAVSHGNVGVIETLLDTGVCDIRRQNRAGYTPVMLAALLIIDTHAHRDIIKRLFSIGDVNVKSATSGQTALMLAASHGRYEMAELLLECGADVNARDDDGSTALMCACEHGYMEIVQLLLSHPQCDSSLMDVDGSTALSIAMEEGYRDIGVLLYAHMNTADQRQSSPPAMEHELYGEAEYQQRENM